ncbi:uncharacterized protein LOC118203620 [Stegodyphus dumicola]|uniref:uncharacterized protein LOC118203620 n=1 Tax=Stegodyphus dumicola TaxID=202533 RepID=UPI0015ADF471|nr:uncharacterized protein LOC118203620 [Stegodyphus dumicola]
MRKLCLAFLIILGLLEISTACLQVQPCIDKIMRHVPRDNLPSEDDLTWICEGILSGFQCVREKEAICEHETNETRPSVVLSKDEEFAIDMCNVESDLRKRYVKTLPCTTQYYRQIPKLQCLMEGEALYVKYRKFLRSLTDENDAEEAEYKKCMVLGYTLKCIADDLQWKCGEEAKAVYWEIVHRLTRGLIGACIKNAIQQLESMFYPSFQIYEEQNSIFS